MKKDCAVPEKVKGAGAGASLASAEEPHHNASRKIWSKETIEPAEINNHTEIIWLAPFGNATIVVRLNSSFSLDSSVYNDAGQKGNICWQ